jgi:hypothetical protein
MFKKATLATALAATALSAASPAMAQGYYNNAPRRGGGDTAGAAIAGGIIGLALGAIIASSANKNRDRDRFADRGWQYRDGYYWDRQGHRYDRDGRLCDEDRRDNQGYYDRRGYDDRGWGQQDRGYYGRDDYYGQRNYRYGY